MRGNLGGIVRSVVLFGTLLVVNLFQMASLVLLPFSRHVFRRFNRGCAQFWWGMCVWGSEQNMGVKVTLSGDDVPPRENAILVANHQQMPDIAILFILGHRKERLGDMKWYVKDALKWVPGVGWGMWFLDCIFLKRNWDADEKRIRQTFSKFLRDSIPVWVVSFSEGTRLTPSKLKKSQEFAAKNGLPVPRHTLIPRTKGFVATVYGLREHIQAVYDITIGYPGRTPTLWEFMQGKVVDVHMNVKRFAVSELPIDKKALSDWLMARFVEKDRILAQFQLVNAFPA